MNSFRRHGGRRVMVVFAASMLTAVVSGCGGGVEPAGATATGTVTLDGQPLTSGLVIFNPVSADASSASGQIGPDGKFEIRTSGSISGLAPGEYKVAIESYKIRSGDQLPDGTEAEEDVPAIPEIYMDSSTSGLTANVSKDGPNDFKFDLKSDAKPASN